MTHAITPAPCLPIGGVLRVRLMEPFDPEVGRYVQLWLNGERWYGWQAARRTLRPLTNAELAHYVSRYRSGR